MNWTWWEERRQKESGKEIETEWGTWEEGHQMKRVFSLPGVKLSEQLGGICCPTFPLWPYIKPRGNKRQAHWLVINITSDTILLSLSQADTCQPISPWCALAKPDYISSSVFTARFRPGKANCRECLIDAVTCCLWTPQSYEQLLFTRCYGDKMNHDSETIWPISQNEFRM